MRGYRIAASHRLVHLDTSVLDGCSSMWDISCTIARSFSYYVEFVSDDSAICTFEDHRRKEECRELAGLETG